MPVMKIQSGKAMPPLNGYDVNGERVTINYELDNRKTLLLSFAPGCDVCEENMPNWKSLMRDVNRQAIRMVVISIRPEGAKEYVIRHDFNSLPVLVEIDPEAKAVYDLVRAPETVLINPDGIVERIWTGVLYEEQQKEIKQLLEVR